MQTVKISTRYGVILGIIALICTALSTAVYFLTKAPIEQAITKQQAELLAQIIPPQSYDNDLLASCSQPNFAKAKTLRIEKICIAEKNHQPVAYAYETIAPDGYSGNIRFLVGITPQGEVLGLRVLEHKETPGLGDKIELRISDWVLGFAQQKISADNLNDWAVKKDGGKFDQFTGATITPRAIVNQTKRSALPLLQQMKSNAVKQEQN